MIRVLIAEDSPVIQKTLVSLLSREPGIRVVGVASNGVEAVRLCKELRPDVVTMDIKMPEMDGLEATRTIMRQCPTRIVIITSLAGDTDLGVSFEALRCGAVEMIEKPRGVLRGSYNEVQARLSSRLKKIMASVPERGEYARENEGDGTVPEAPRPARPVAGRGGEPGVSAIIPAGFFPEVIAFGGSTGAPAVLANVLATLPADFPVPILVVQRIADGFVQGMASWLSECVEFEVRVAGPADRARPGQVLFAPDSGHLTVLSGGSIVIRKASSTEENVPSADRLFESVAKVYGRRAIGIVLSGEGRDGAAGLARMRDRGAVTVAQSLSSAVVEGMPSTALEEKAALHGLNPRAISDLLLQLSSTRSRS